MGVVCLSRPRVHTSHVLESLSVPVSLNPDDLASHALEFQVPASPHPTSLRSRALMSQVPHLHPTFSHIHWTISSDTITKLVGKFIHQQHITLLHSVIDDSHVPELQLNENALIVLVQL